MRRYDIFQLVRVTPPSPSLLVPPSPTFSPVKKRKVVEEEEEPDETRKRIHEFGQEILHAVRIVRDEALKVVEEAQAAFAKAHERWPQYLEQMEHSLAGKDRLAPLVTAESPAQHVRHLQMPPTPSFSPTREEEDGGETL
jgi:hypothetical protein